MLERNWRGLSGIATTLSGALALLALVLAAVGIYGVAAYFVGRRTRETASASRSARTSARCSR